MTTTLERTGPPTLLRLTAYALFLTPADEVLAPLGASGYLAMVLALVLAVAWLASALLGLHDPVPMRHPGRLALTLLLGASILSYVRYASGDTITRSGEGQLSADRWLLMLFASAGIALVTTQSVRTLEHARILIGSLVNAATLCAVIAIMQFTTHTDPVELIRGAMVGFVDNGGSTPFQDRDGLTRVAGTTFHPIELAVVSSMLLPLAVWRLIYDGRTARWLRIASCVLLLSAVALTVSRSGVLSLVVGMGVALVFLPRAARRWGYLLAPIAVAAFFVATPGLLGTLTGAIGAGTSDSSITNRLDNYPRVAALVAHHPVLGTGPGTYLPDDATLILDNQYLGSAITLGLVGAAAVVAYFVVPALFGLVAAQFAREPRLRALTGSVAASATVAAVASATFDSLGFPVFALLFPFVLGLSGSCWLLVRAELGLPSALSTDARVRVIGEIDHSPERQS
ncbi:O-antigen ligase family protein [Rathayibacter sp. VKM Ac-2754]|uniref:O-antigen ligase family protein n=1 Tax=Rathayibacter sp. VKM Ac-2754 TaxID=2609251 RepID=UPI001358248D|nr:O-antigen ligase family protein [Rathayibacter sp. VKM Ac-2754]MWV59866.1 O-antigen ligase family protein [Rathayibacter sp. VKM Ac-2754]